MTWLYHHGFVDFSMPSTSSIHKIDQEPETQNAVAMPLKRNIPPYRRNGNVSLTNDCHKDTIVGVSPTTSLPKELDKIKLQLANFRNSNPMFKSDTLYTSEAESYSSDEDEFCRFIDANMHLVDDVEHKSVFDT